MTRRLFGILVFAGIAAASLRVFAHPGHTHKIMGTITMVAADHVMLKTKDGKDLTVKVASTTKVMRGKTAMRIEALKDGTRVVITAVGDKAPYTATLIQVGAAPKTVTTARK